MKRSTVAAPVDAAQTDTATRTAEILHSNGQESADTVETATALLRPTDPAATVDLSWAGVTVHGQGQKRFLPAVPAAINMRRVEAVLLALNAYRRDGRSLSNLDQHLSNAAALPPAPLWLFMLACITGGTSLAVIFGARTLPGLIVIAISCALGGLVRRLLGRIDVGPLAQAFVAALVAGLVGGIAVQLDLSTPLRLVAVCPAMILVPGPHILNGLIDIARLRVPLGTARLVFAAATLGCIGVGVSVGLALCGVTLPLEPASVPVPVWADVPAAGIAAASFCVYFSAPARLFFWPVIVGMLAHAARWLVMGPGHQSIAVGALVACILVSVILVPISRRRGLPFAAVGFASVVALVPGVYIFRTINGLFTLLQEPATADTTHLLGVASDATTASAIIVGMMVGLLVPMRILELARRRTVVNA
ncbi:threonine/serine exporter family protein [Curtobacterium flaccumfaciens]|uniref:threonine/serine ThrE exporter family protein n=1 Tax=Curtobacterium flaccumfaciens TaxID=2035 RepID=UPI001BE09D9E|nr:threonine/serine exporter family protein [Curtobacterium flaccumfaciens]MBT1585604.1 threonine/serine exporter family protein [Curtobacterium flaccumfaciens pv. flaccumfaciens]MCS5495158.1 threonine/serine exporter family protein [Curtobacterium flaccumfaciens pv. flaccumfaciens]MCX2798194.1 threonine/serine exporter family protein [Curtobacterium flaccumfaciens pv. flaccumfaciens]